MAINRFTLHKIFAAVSIVSGIAGFSDLGSAQVSGLARALACIFFILFLIFNLLKNEATDEAPPKRRNNSGCDFGKIREAQAPMQDKLTA